MLLEVLQDKDECIKFLVEITTFTTKDGKTVQGVTDTKRLTGTRLQICYGKVKKWYKENIPDNDFKNQEEE